MFGGPPDAGGSAGPSGRQPHGRPPTSPSVDPAAGAPHGFYGQPQAYQQQWLPAQFAGFSLGGQTYYAPAPGMPGSPVLAGPGPGPDTYMAAMQPHLQMPLAMGVPPEGMAPRGWGGVQLHDQQHDRGYGGRRALGRTGVPLPPTAALSLACAPRWSLPPTPALALVPAHSSLAVDTLLLQGRRPRWLPAGWRPRGRPARHPRRRATRPKLLRRRRPAGGRRSLLG